MGLDALSWSRLRADHLGRVVARFVCELRDLDEELRLALEQAAYAPTHFPGLVCMLERPGDLERWAEDIGADDFRQARPPAVLTVAIADDEQRGGGALAALELWTVKNATQLAAALASPGRWITFEVTLRDRPDLARDELEDLIDAARQMRAHGIDSPLDVGWNDVRAVWAIEEVRKGLIPGLSYVMDVDVLLYAVGDHGHRYAHSVHVTLTATGP